MMNWYLGWGMILSAFGTGAVIGLFIHDENFLGGYQSYRRRMLRLGHIAQAALGMLNLIHFAVTPVVDGWPAQLANLGLAGGAVAMPTVCFLTAWRPAFRHMFFIPVSLLMAGVIQTLINGAP